MISDWENKLADQVQRNWLNYRRIVIDLSTAKTNEKQNVTGEFIYVEAVSDESVTATVRLNRNTNDTIELKTQTKIQTVFQCFYLTNNAQSGKSITLLIGINFDYEKQQGTKKALIQSIVKVTNVAANTNTVPASCNTERVLIKAHNTNAGLVWLNFRTAAVQAACLPLVAGESVTVSLENLDKININFVVANEIAWLVYEI